MKIDQTLLKYLGILALVIFLSAITVRFFARGESLTDYAEKNPDVAYLEPIPEEDEHAKPADTPSAGLTESKSAESGLPENSVAGPAGSQTARPDGTKPTENPAAQTGSMKPAEPQTPQADDAGLGKTSASPQPAEPQPENEEKPSHAEGGSTSLNPENNAAADDSRIVYKEGFYYEKIPADVINRITGISYKENPNITLDDLRYVKVLYHDFSSETQVGELICNQAIAQDLAEIFYELYKNDYQIERIALVDEYDGDDTLSMEANNTSCFNYRVVDGTTRLSKHALGLAIDINPYYNPYIVFNKNGTGETYISPKGSEIYADRSQSFPYKIDSEDLCYRLFTEHGFTWGGNWNSTKDYQHFQKAVN